MRIRVSKNSILRGYPEIKLKDGTVMILGGQYKQTLREVLNRIDEYIEDDINVIEDEDWLYKYLDGRWYKVSK